MQLWKKVILLIGALVLAGCQAGVLNLEKSGTVEVTLSDGSRSLLPGTSLVATSYKAKFESGGILRNFDLSQGTGIFSLDPGLYTLTVEAFNTTDLLIARGSTSVTVSSGQTSQASVNVTFLPGNGTFKIDAKVLGLDVVNPQLEANLIAEPSGLAIPLNFTLNGDIYSGTNSGVPTGNYTLNLLLKSGSTTIVSQGVEWPFVLAGATTTGGASFYQDASGKILTSITAGSPQVYKEAVSQTQAPALGLSPDTGSYQKGSSVLVSMSGEAGALIRYTLDGTDPTSTSNIYSVPFALPTTTVGSFVIKATAMVSGKTLSVVTSKTYSITEDVYTLPETLGALYTPNATTFRIWSPDSTSVTVDVNSQTLAMVKVPNFAGYTDVYQVVVAGDLKNKEYQIKLGGAPVRDPYALMAVPGTTKGVVVDMQGIKPTDGSWAARPALVNREDSIIYEVHVRDFTIDSTSGVDGDKKGKFLGMVQTGTTYNGSKTGIDHLKELGVTHIQLLPTYDFATNMYNWGYDPVNYNVPEEQYSQTTDPEARVREFKDLINEYHKNGFRVVLDVVYNHTYSKDALSGITGKYYTTVDLSGCGNSLNTGVPMVSRMMRDSLEQWVANYNVDGFRFDLIGVYHYNEVKAWGEYLNGKYSDRNLLMYGEPWNGYATDPEDSQKVRMGKVPAMASGHIGVFNGKYREDIKGGNDNKTLSYMSGGNGTSWWGAIAAGSRGSLTAAKSTAILANDWDSMFAYDPEQSINYISAHDNFDLWDKIIYSNVSGGATGYAARMDKFAMGIILTSQGIPFIHAGDEFLRSKAVPDWTYAHNSYNASDNYNKIRWSDKVTNASVFNYYKNAVALRKSSPGLRLTSWDEIKTKVTTKLNAGANSAAGINCVNDPSLPVNVVVNEIDSDGVNGPDLVVVFNPASNFTLTLPTGTWKKVFDINGTVSTTDTLCEGTSVTIFQKQ